MSNGEVINCLLDADMLRYISLLFIHFPKVIEGAKLFKKCFKVGFLFNGYKNNTLSHSVAGPPQGLVET